MKVLHVIDALGPGGGAEHSLATLLPRLRDRGIDSSVVCLWNRVGGLQQKLLDDGFDVEVLRPGPWVSHVVSLRRFVRAQAPDLVHATLVDSCLLARVALMGLGIPLLNSLVNTTYDPIRSRALGIPSWKLRLLQAVDSFTARHLADHFHAISDAVRVEAVEVLGIDPATISVIPRGRDATALGEREVARRLAVRAGLGIDADAPVVLNVGRQDNQKNQPELIRAFVGVHKRYPSAVLLIAGRPGNASEHINEVISAVGAQDSVRILGHRDDIADLYVAADIFALPSLYEGLGCSLLEAMALGTPIIGSDAPAIREVLGDGAYGVVTPRGDTGCLTDAISELLGAPTYAATLATKARRRYLEKYELGEVVEATIALYNSVAARGTTLLSRGRARGGASDAGHLR